MADDYTNLLQQVDFLDEATGECLKPVYKQMDKSVPWDVDKFTSGYEGFKALRDSRGIAEFSQLYFGNDSVSSMPANLAEFNKGNVIVYAQGQAVDFGMKHLNTISELASPEILIPYAMSSIIRFKGPDQWNVYNGVVDTVNTQVDDLNAIRSDPIAYVNRKLSNLSDLEKAFWSPQSIGILVGNFQNRAHNVSVRAIGDYGSSKFVATNVRAVHQEAKKQTVESDAIKATYVPQIAAATSNANKTTLENTNTMSPRNLTT